MEIVITASFIFREGFDTSVFKAFEKVTKQTLLEEGCLDYTLHRNLKEPDRFFFYEKWKSKELWLKHVNEAHVLEFKKSIDSDLLEFKVEQLQELIY